MKEDLLPFLSFEIREPSDSQLTLFVLSCLAEVVQRLCSAAGRRSALLQKGAGIDWRHTGTIPNFLGSTITIKIYLERLIASNEER